MDTALSHTERHDSLLERLVLSDTAFVSDSEITEFSVKRSSDDSKDDISINLKYFVEPAGNIDAVCEKLGDDIKRWIDSGRLKDVCEMTGMSSLVTGRVIYDLPMMAGNHKAEF